MCAREAGVNAGRIKDMIIRGGENIYPREIEDVLIGHPAFPLTASGKIRKDALREQLAALPHP